MRILLRRQIPKWKILNIFFLPDPRILNDIKSQYALSTNEMARLDCAKRFSEVLSRICIGQTTKSTRIDRMRLMDDALLSLLGNSRDGQLKLLDLGASDGISTHRLVERIAQERNQKAEAIALDLYVELAEFTKWPFREYRFNDGYQVLVCVGPFGFQLSPIAVARRPLERILGRWVSKLQFVTSKMTKSRAWSLLNPLIQDSSVKLVYGSVFEVTPEYVGAFDIVRASNVLNLGYFSEQMIQVGLQATQKYVKDGGYLVISRNLKSPTGEIEHGTIWRRAGSRFDVVAVVGDGSEISNFVK